MCHRQCFLGEKYKQKELIHDTVTKSQNMFYDKTRLHESKTSNFYIEFFAL